MGAPELLIVLVIVLLLFGASQLPRLGRSFGEARRELKAGLQESRAEEGSRPA